jgi:hypothetical protein
LKKISEVSKVNVPDTGYGIAEVSSGFTIILRYRPYLSAAQIRALLKQKPIEIPTAENITHTLQPQKRPYLSLFF